MFFNVVRQIAALSRVGLDFVSGSLYFDFLPFFFFCSSVKYTFCGSHCSLTDSSELNTCY